MDLISDDEKLILLDHFSATKPNFLSFEFYNKNFERLHSTLGGYCYWWKTKPKGFERRLKFLENVRKRLY